MNALRTEPDTEFFNTLSAEEQKEVQILHDYIEKGGYTLDELMAYLYAIPREVYGELDDKELKKHQGKFFQNVYTLLISKTKGPRLYLFLYAIETEKYLKLLKF
jgi:lysyl-tRNA synthetase class 1